VGLKPAPRKILLGLALETDEALSAPASSFSMAVETNGPVMVPSGALPLSGAAPIVQTGAEGHAIAASVGATSRTTARIAAEWGNSETWLSGMSFPHHLPPEWQSRIPELVVRLDRLVVNLEKFQAAIPGLIEIAKSNRLNATPSADELTKIVAFAVTAATVASKQLLSATPQVPEISLARQALELAGRTIRDFLKLVGLVVSAYAVSAATVAGAASGADIDIDLHPVLDGLKDFLGFLSTLL
jgi:hypothetical protein